MYNNSWDSVSVLYTYCIKYIRLKDIVIPALSSMEFKSPAKAINIYLNLNELFRIYHPDQNSPASNNDLSLASAIINIAGHYNAYLRANINMPIKIHLVYGSYSPYFNRGFYPEYNLSKTNKMNNDKYTLNIINDNIEIMKLLTKYIPRLYFNTTSFEPGVLMYHLIKSRPDEAHLIIDKDPYNYQLVSNNCCILRPKKRKNADDVLEDCSYIVHRHNVFDVYCKERGMKPGCNVFDRLDSGLYTLFLSINGTNLRGLPARGKRANTSAKILETAVLQDAVLNSHNTITPESDIIKYVNESDLYNYYCSLDIPTQHKAYMASSEINNLHFEELFDKNAIHEINNKYFGTCPIILDNF